MIPLKFSCLGSSKKQDPRQWNLKKNCLKFKDWANWRISQAKWTEYLHSWLLMHLHTTNSARGHIISTSPWRNNQNTSARRWTNPGVNKNWKARAPSKIDGHIIHVYNIEMHWRGPSIYIYIYINMCGIKLCKYEAWNRPRMRIGSTHHFQDFPFMFKRDQI